MGEYSYWVNMRPDLLVTVPVYLKHFKRPQHTVPKSDFLIGGPRKQIRSWLRVARKHLHLCDPGFEYFEQLVDMFLKTSGARYPLKGNQALVRGLNNTGYSYIHG